MTPFSATVAAEIFATVPAWQAFAREERAEDGRAYLVVELPLPEGSRASAPLRIDTANDEITVHFDHFHAHFERWGFGEPGTEHEAAATIVYAIVGETVLVVSAWDGARWCGSGILGVGDPIDPPEGATRILVRSWSGRHDEDRDV